MDSVRKYYQYQRLVEYSHWLETVRSASVPAGGPTRPAFSMDYGGWAGGAGAFLNVRPAFPEEKMAPALPSQMYPVYFRAPAYSALRTRPIMVLPDIGAAVRREWSALRGYARALAYYYFAPQKLAA